MSRCSATRTEEKEQSPVQPEEEHEVVDRVAVDVEPAAVVDSASDCRSNPLQLVTRSKRSSAASSSSAASACECTGTHGIDLSKKLSLEDEMRALKSDDSKAASKKPSDSHLIDIESEASTEIETEMDAIRDIRTSAVCDAVGARAAAFGSSALAHYFGADDNEIGDAIDIGTADELSTVPLPLTSSVSIIDSRSEARVVLDATGVVFDEVIESASVPTASAAEVASAELFDFERRFMKDTEESDTSVISISSAKMRKLPKKSRGELMVRVLRSEPPPFVADTADCRSLAEVRSLEHTCALAELWLPPSGCRLMEVLFALNRARILPVECGCGGDCVFRSALESTGLRAPMFSRSASTPLLDVGDDHLGMAPPLARALSATGLFEDSEMPDTRSALPFDCVAATGRGAFICENCGTARPVSQVCEESWIPNVRLWTRFDHVRHGHVYGRLEHGRRAADHRSAAALRTADGDEETNALVQVPWDQMATAVTHFWDMRKTEPFVSSAVRASAAGSSAAADASIGSTDVSEASTTCFCVELVLDERDAVSGNFPWELPRPLSSATRSSDSALGYLSPENLRVGDVVDAMDCKHRWYLAVVRATEPSLVVHFLFFRRKFDERPQRCAPAFTHSQTRGISFNGGDTLFDTSRIRVTAVSPTAVRKRDSRRRAAEHRSATDDRLQRPVIDSLAHGLAAIGYELSSDDEELAAVMRVADLGWHGSHAMAEAAAASTHFAVGADLENLEFAREIANSTDEETDARSAVSSTMDLMALFNPASVAWPSQMEQQLSVSSAGATAGSPRLLAAGHSDDGGTDEKAKESSAVDGVGSHKDAAARGYGGALSEWQRVVGFKEESSTVDELSLTEFGQLLERMKGTLAFWESWRSEHEGVGERVEELKEEKAEVCRELDAANRKKTDLLIQLQTVEERRLVVKRRLADLSATLATTEPKYEERRWFDAKCRAVVSRTREKMRELEADYESWNWRQIVCWLQLTNNGEFDVGYKPHSDSTHSSATGRKAQIMRLIDFIESKQLTGESLCMFVDSAQVMLTSVVGIADGRLRGRLQTEVKRLIEATTERCSICCSGKPDHVLGPCGHAGICQLCARRLTECPFCKRKIVSRIQMFQTIG